MENFIAYLLEERPLRKEADPQRLTTELRTEAEKKKNEDEESKAVEKKVSKQSWKGPQKKSTTHVTSKTLKSKKKKQEVHE